MTGISEAEFKKRAARIKLLVLDVDGVLTDGSILLDDSGRELKRFHVRDGFAIRSWLRVGLHLGVISGRTSGAVEHRLRELEVTEVVQGTPIKAPAYREMLQRFGVTTEETCCIGDDLADLPITTASGIGVAVADADPQLRQRADWITKSAGGQGAVRELIESLLSAKGLWQEVIDHYAKPA